MSNVLLIGDSIVDYYIYGNINRKNPESDVPLVTIEKTEIKEGGAANVLRNLQSLGISTDFFTVVGPCCIKNRVVVDGKVILRFDEERKADNTDLRKRLAKKDISTYNIAVISDYDKGAIDRIEDLIFDLNRANCWTIVDPKKENLSRYRDADIIKPNLLEFERYAGPATDENIRKYAEEHNHKLVVVTRGADGVTYYSRSTDKVYHLKSRARNVVDVTGAGDSFLAGMVYGMIKCCDDHDIVSLGNKAAAACVEKFGTYHVTEEDLIRKTIFTNGCFDVLHRGHIELLKNSKELGNHLIVGLNSDNSVRKLKGANRPINNQEDRKAALEAIKYVDKVIIFDEETPYELIKQINPAIITKSSQYHTYDVVGKDVAEVVILPHLDGYSTTEILDGICRKD